MISLLRTLLILVGCHAAASPAHGATITIRAGLGTTTGLMMASSLGQPLSAGNYFISAGTFDTPPSTLAELNFYKPFASGTSPVTGSFRGVIAANFTAIPANPSAFNSKEIYILAGNGTTFATSTEFAVLRSSGAAWLFPADVSTADSTVVQLSGAADVVGVAGTCVIDNSNVRDWIAMPNLAGGCPVPEPGGGLLVIFAGLFTVSRRCSRRRAAV